MEQLHDKRFPNESAEYRTARNRLLEAEMELRRKIEDVARMRREMPLGGRLKEDYQFDELDSAGKSKKTNLSSLFDPGKNALIIYSMMYAPKAELPCTSCNSIIDGLDGAAPHIRDKVNFAVAMKSPIEKVHAWAAKRGWRNHRLISSVGNTYNADYFAENDDSDQLPALNVFEKTPDGIYHAYSTELLYVNSEPGQDGRHVDMIWPVWNMFDYTREGRGTDWYPRFTYARK